MILRDFLYLDRQLVRTFLAQAEGGEFDEVTERQTSTGKGGVGGRIGTTAIGVSGEKSKETAHESEAVVRQVAASEFDRLFTKLEADGLRVIEDVSDAAEVGDLRRKEFVEVDSRVKVAGLQQVMELFAKFSDALPVMESLGTDVKVDPKMLAGMQALTSLGGPDKPLPVVATVRGAAGFRVAAELDRSMLIASSLEGDASILLKIQRVLRPDERYLVGDPFGGLLKLMPEKDRAKIAESLKSDQLAELGVVGDVEIGPPAVVGTVVAIYR